MQTIVNGMLADIRCICNKCKVRFDVGDTNKDTIECPKCGDHTGVNSHYAPSCDIWPLLVTNSKADDKWKEMGCDTLDRLAGCVLPTGKF